jgi:4-hydroxybenzoate polyprenyltransferase
MSLFLSLALAKRATEISRSAVKRPDSSQVRGRGYQAQDLPFVMGIGTASAVIAPVIMALYLIAEAFPMGLYHQPQYLWVIPVIICLGLGRIWLLCGRGKLADDPVSFAMRDHASLTMGAVALLAFVFAVGM